MNDEEVRQLVLAGAWLDAARRLAADAHNTLEFLLARADEERRPPRPDTDSGIDLLGTRPTDLDDRDDPHTGPYD